MLGLARGVREVADMNRLSKLLFKFVFAQRVQI